MLTDAATAPNDRGTPYRQPRQGVSREYRCCEPREHRPQNSSAEVQDTQRKEHDAADGGAMYHLRRALREYKRGNHEESPAGSESDRRRTDDMPLVELQSAWKY